jgi:hypothetical protein
MGRRAGVFGLALGAYDVWRRLPPAQRRRIVAMTREHGPRLAAGAVKKAQAARKARSGRSPGA